MAKLAEKSLMTVSNSVNKPHLVKLETMEEIWNLLAEL
jgi:DNA-binding LacI/PurR family transcriptional regulator